jgi:hypothetical protein
MKKPSKTALRAWQRMLSGRRLDLLDPSPLDIEIEDIAHGLARVARWNGQTHGAHIFSVAQHTLLVEAVLRQQTPRVDHRIRLAAMLHDAPEYVIGDMISPFKAVIGARRSSLSPAGWDRAHPLVVHCYAGVSRSTASAFIAACALAPHRDEAAIAQAIRQAADGRPGRAAKSAHRFRRGDVPVPIREQRHSCRDHFR